MDSSPTPDKWCTGCAQTLAPEAFYRSKQGALVPICRACRKVLNRGEHLTLTPKPQPPIPAEKACTRCSDVKALERFSPRKSARDGRSSHCRDCRNEEKAHYNEAHSEERKAYNRQYYRDHPEECGKRIRASIAKKPEKYQKIHSDWKKQNVGACRAMAHRRYARAKSAGSWTQDDWERLKAKYDWRCLMCNRQEMTDGIRLCFDHVIPLSLGGWNIISNAQPLCRSCNSLKYRKVVDLRK